MKSPSALVVIILLAALPAFGGAKDDGWENLKHVTWQRSYTFVTRDLHCVTGEIASVSTEALTVKLPKGGVTKFDRGDVLQVGSGSYQIYSGRSSWSDVIGYKTYPGERCRIRTQNGKTHEGKLLGVSGAEITIGQTEGKITIAKSDVSRVDIIGYTPLSDNDEYWVQECAVLPICVLNAHLWPRWVGIGRWMRVRLYDSSLPEDNHPVTCKDQH
jgi:hypothetical protein